jgi:multiple sugar transport system substrate-binding protein
MQMKITRRTLLIASTAIGIAALTAGVMLASPWGGGSTQTSPSAAQTRSSPAGQARKLVILARSDYHQDAHLKSLIPYFKERAQGVEVEYVPKGYDELYQVALLAMQRGSAEYDVLYLDEPWLASFRQYAEEIDGVDTGGYPPNLIKRVQMGNGLYAVPILGNYNFYFYRRDLLDKLNESPPKSLDDIMRLAQEAQARLSSQRMYGFTGNFTVGLGSGAAGDSYALLLLAHGGAFFDPRDGVTPALDSQEAVDALKMAKALVKAGHPQIATWTNLRDIHESVYSGETFSGLVWNGWIQYVDDPQRSKVVGLVEVMPLPGRRGPVSHTGVWHYVVPKSSQNKELARQFVKLATSYDAQLKAQLEVGMPPTRATVYQNPEVKKRNRLAEAYYKIVEAGTPARTSPIWPQVQRPLNEIIAKYFMDQITAEAAVKEMHKILVEKSKEAGLI